MASDPETMSAPAYPDAANPDLLPLIPLDAKVVLDVGCGAGALGAGYLRRNPNARMLGIDLDPAAAATAARRLSEVAMVDVEAEPMPFSVPDGIDCIVYGDVLEHLRDPWRVLRLHAEMLTATGSVLVCVPNVEHWSMQMRLLAGSFEYEEMGLFDRTHLRWFSIDSMRRALEGAGLVPCDVRARVFDAEPAGRFVAAIAPALAALGIDRTAYARRATPLQYIWRARRQAVPPIAVRSTMLAPVGGVSDVRVLAPMRAITTDPSVFTQIAPTEEMPAPTPGLPGICILHRPILIGPDGLARLRDLLAKGFVIVVEFDDHPDFMPILQNPELLNFRGVHAVQTSTPQLAETLRAINPEVAVFPNAIEELPEIVNFTNPDRLTLFFGAINREEDWLPYIGALNAVARAAGPRLQFAVLHDRPFFEALETPYKSFTPTTDYPTYLAQLAQADLSFMPLRDTAFNRAKSDLKFLEAAACRVAALASPIAYGDTIEDGVTGLLFRDAAELQDRLLRLVANPDAARSLADAARAYVSRERMMADQVGSRIRWYRSLLERRESLTASLLARVPELAQTS